MKEIIKHSILPHDLNQAHTTCLIVLKVLKVAHEIFTWNRRKYHIIGRYGGHKWHGFCLKVWMHEKHSLSVQSFRLARLFEANTRYQPEQQRLT